MSFVINLFTVCMVLCGILMPKGLKEKIGFWQLLDSTQCFELLTQYHLLTENQWFQTIFSETDHLLSRKFSNLLTTVLSLNMTLNSSHRSRTPDTICKWSFLPCEKFEIQKWPNLHNAQDNCFSMHAFYLSPSANLFIGVFIEWVTADGQDVQIVTIFFHPGSGNLKN